MRPTMVSAVTLTEFLLARIAEDEADAADDYGDNALHRNDCEIHPQGLENTACNCDAPARVRAECEAKRKIIESAWDDLLWIEIHGGWGRSQQELEAIG